MNPSQKASFPAGLELELPVLTDVVDEVTLPVLSEEPPFELPDFDFSSELDAMATALPADAGMIELEIPAELPFEAVLDVGPAPAAVEPVVDFSGLPSLDLEVAALDELALDDVLPGLARGTPPPPATGLSTGMALGEDPFDFVLTPADSAASAVADGASGSAPVHDEGFAIPELTMEWSESAVSVEAEEVGAASPLPGPVELPRTEPAPVHEEGFAIPELTMEWSESAVSVEVEEVGAASPLPGPVELQGAGPAQVRNDDFAIPELTMEWSEPPVSVEAEEVGTASSELLEPPSPWPTPVPAEGDTVAAETVAPVSDPWVGAMHALADELAEPEAGICTGTPDVESEPAADPVAALAESADGLDREAVEAARPVPAVARSIDIESLPSGVLGGGVGPEPEAGSIHDQLPWDTTEYDSDAAESPEAVAAALSELAALLEPASGGILPVQAAPSVESEGVPDGVTSDVPVLLDEAGPADMELEPFGMEGDGTGAFGADLGSGEPEALAVDYATSGTGGEPVTADFAPADVAVPLFPTGGAGEQGEVAAVPQPDAMASNGLAEPLVANATLTAGEGEPVPETGVRSCTVVDEQALIDSLTQKILPRMKVELSLWLQDALEMQARQMLSGVMHQLREDYEMLFNETLRESLRQAITEIGRDEREGES